MTKCIVCGKESDRCLCESCAAVADLERLCGDIIAYSPARGENPLWDSIAAEMKSPYNFKNLAFALSADLPTPKREYWQILSLCGTRTDIFKSSRPWFYGAFERAVSVEGLSAAEKNRLYGLALDTYYKDYRYVDAEKIAVVLRGEPELPWQCFYSLAEYYTTTRRYDLADEVIGACLKQYAGDDYVLQKMQGLSGANAKQREKALTGEQEYLPFPTENRGEVRKRYADFMATIGIEVSLPTPRVRADSDPIPEDQYPNPVETRDTDLESFVAFDLETTGRNPTYDSIIEIGAVRVVGEEVVETEEFCFRELVHPLDSKKVSMEVEALTGITNDDVKTARTVQEVLPDFMKFVGDSVLVGFNCMAFDSKFMVRAGRYSHILIENRYFDVMRFAEDFRDRLGLGPKKFSLEDLAEKLEIANPRAHRALADAITTARAFIELKKLAAAASPASAEDLFADLDNW